MKFEKYKFADETSLIQALGKAKKEFQPLFHSCINIIRKQV